MYSVDLMVEEHANICRMLKVVRGACCGILEGGKVEDDDFRKMIDFIRRYADEHHHGKEEKFLFPEMTRLLGPVAENLVTHGMLVEHNLGRAHVMALETALKLYRDEPATDHKLDAITEAMGYARLLQAHIEKENNVVYTFAERELPENAKADIDAKSREYEARDASAAVREKYLRLLEELEGKYL